MFLFAKFFIKVHLCRVKADLFKNVFAQSPSINLVEDLQVSA